MLGKLGSIYIPSLKPGELLEIPIYLKYGSMSSYAYDKYKNGDTDITPLTLNAYVDYSVPNIAEKAKNQGVKGTDANRPEKYVWDKSPNYSYTKTPFNMMKKLGRYDLIESWK